VLARAVITRPVPRPAAASLRLLPVTSCSRHARQPATTATAVPPLPTIASAGGHGLGPMAGTTGDLGPRAPPRPHQPCQSLRQAAATAHPPAGRPDPGRVAAPIGRVDQCESWPGPRPVSVSAITSATCLSVIAPGAPARGASPSPVSRSRRHPAALPGRPPAVGPHQHAARRPPSAARHRTRASSLRRPKSSTWLFASAQASGRAAARHDGASHGGDFGG